MNDQQRSMAMSMLGQQSGINPMLMQMVKQKLAEKQGMPPGGPQGMPPVATTGSPPPQGMPVQGVSPELAQLSPPPVPQGPPPQGTPLQGVPPQGMPPELAQMPPAGMPPGAAGGLPPELLQQQLSPEMLQKLAMQMRA